MRKLLAFVLLITFVCGSHWKWEQTRNHTGYDVFATKANDKHDLDDNEYPMSIKKSHPSVRNDKKKCYITGYLESSTGAADMFEAVYFNYAEGQLGVNATVFPQKVLDYIHNQLQWMDDQINKHTMNVEKKNGVLIKNNEGKDIQIDSETEYWLAVDCVLHWVQGMWHGLEKSGSKLTFDQFIVLPYMADMEDILNAYGGEDYVRRTENIRPTFQNVGDCTIVVKDTEDDVYIRMEPSEFYPNYQVAYCQPKLLTPKAIANEIFIEERTFCFVTGYYLNPYRSNKAKLIDCTMGGEDAHKNFLKCAIPTAVFLDTTNKLTDKTSKIPYAYPKKEQVVEAMQDLGMNLDDNIVLYCQPHLVHSMTRVYHILNSHGFTDVSILDGGLFNYIKQGLPTAPGVDYTGSKSVIKYIKEPTAHLIMMDEIVEFALKKKPNMQLL